VGVGGWNKPNSITGSSGRKKPIAAAVRVVQDRRKMTAMAVATPGSMRKLDVAATGHRLIPGGKASEGAPPPRAAAAMVGAAVAATVAAAAATAVEAVEPLLLPWILLPPPSKPPPF
jgi:hypothetical protein